MKIWFFNHYASTPDQPVTGAYYLAKALVGLGNDVTFFASSFNYYTRSEIRLEKGEIFKEEECNGIEFLWVRTIPYKRLFARALNMISYFFIVLYAGVKKKERPSVVVGTCPHLLGVLAAYIVSRVKKCKFVFEVRDLWPQTFVDNSHVSESNIIVIVLRWLERFLYKKADLIITLLPFAHEYICKCGISRDKIVLIPNGVDLSNYSDNKGFTGGIRNQHVFMYIGGHAKYHGIDVLLDAAKRAKDENIQNIRFVFIGDGVEKERLIRYARDLGLENVEFRKSVPRSEISISMNEATVLLFHAKSEIVLKYGFSSNKLCDFFMSGKPILCTVESRYNPVEEAGAGICVPPKPALLVDAIKTFIKMSPEKRADMGRNGIEYARNHYDANKLAAHFEKAISLL